MARRSTERRRRGGEKNKDKDYREDNGNGKEEKRGDDKIKMFNEKPHIHGQGVFTPR